MNLNIFIMGLFDIFRKKRSKELSEAVENAFHILYPGGRKEMIRLTNELIEKLNGRYDAKVVANNYTFILSSLFSEADKSLEFITGKVLRRVNNVLAKEDIEVIYNHAIENNGKLSTFMPMYRIMQEMSKNGTELDVMPEGEGEFGLVASNPIPIRGIPENEKYLKRLRLHNGEKITWWRVGSCSSPNIPNIIDTYEIYNSKGSSICYLHLCPYNKKTSNRAPRGFILVQ